MIPLVLALAVAAPLDKKADAEFEKKVAAARDKAVKYLKEQQKADGTWENPAGASLAGMEGGPTALVLLALLEAGVPTDDPAVVKGMDFLGKLKSEKTYVVGLQTQVLARVNAKGAARHIQSNADWLVKNAIRRGGNLEGWSYPGNTIADNSNTHFAVMGLHAAAKAGAKVDADLWKQLRDFYARTQQKDGQWAYHNAGGERGGPSMTLAGLLGLTVATSYDKAAKGPDPAFEKGLKALLAAERWGGKSEGSAWFTAAELGRALGTDTFKADKAARAWYREGVEAVVKGQQEDGSWKSGGNAIDKSYPVISTAFALYLLGPPKK